MSGQEDTPQIARRSVTALIWLSLAFALFAINLVGLYSELRRREALNVDGLGEQAHALFYAYREMNRFMVSLGRYTHDDPFEFAGHEDVEMRFDLLVSRVSLFSEGELHRKLADEPDLQQLLSEIGAALTLTETLLPQLPPDARDPRYLRIVETLDPLRSALFNAGRKDLMKISLRSESLAQAVSGGTHYLIAPVLAAGLLLLLFTAELRRSRKLATELSERTLQLLTANAQLAHQAGHDPLTGLPNRALLEKLLGEGLACARRDGSELALFFLDLDRFKPVNDSLGHGIGDGMLRMLPPGFPTACAIPIL